MKIHITIIIILFLLLVILYLANKKCPSLECTSLEVPNWNIGRMIMNYKTKNGEDGNIELYLGQSRIVVKDGALAIWDPETNEFNRLPSDKGDGPLFLELNNK